MSIHPLSSSANSNDAAAQRDFKVQRLSMLLWLILGTSLAIHVCCLWIARQWASHWIWPHEPFHATVETAGGMIALSVAWMLISLDRINSGTSFNISIASALIGMGVFDGLHAMVHVGPAFVWLHSLATLAGGTLFAMIWLPRSWQQRARGWPLAVLAFALIIGMTSLIFPTALPAMTTDGRFTPLAKSINLAGGVLLFLAAGRLLSTYRTQRNIDDLLFCLHCGLFGAAAIMFEQSKLWDFTWWGWHFLRLMAYGVALGFVIRTDMQATKALRDRAASRARLKATQETAEHLRVANKRLAREQFLLNSLVNNIPDPVFFKDRDGRIIRANQAMANDAGFNSPEELIGKTDAEIWIGDLREQSFADEQRILETGVPLINKEEMPMVEGGPEHWVLVTKMPLIDTSGETVGIFGIARDITDLKRQELERREYTRELAQAKADLERSNQDLQQFAYVASHDLQEPLRAVSGHCQLLKMELGEHPDQRVSLFLSHAVDGAKRMQELINNLLDYARIQTRGNEFSLSSSQAIVDQAVSNLAESIRESSAVIRYHNLPEVVGDHVQLTRVFQNLIGNAIKFRGDRTPVIEIQARRKDASWVFSIKDNGIGIEPEYFERIFVIFQRLHTRDDFPGTGLGLAICKRIIERHGGRVWLESEPNCGTTFFFTIPIQS